MPLDISRQTLETERVVDSRIIKALIETDAMAQGADEVLLCDANVCCRKNGLPCVLSAAMSLAK